MIRTTNFIVIFLALSWSAFGAGQAQAAQFTGLGDLPGGIFFSLAFGVSGDGSIVVGGSISDSGMEAFRWTDDTGMVGLGQLPNGGLGSLAHDLSTGETVVGGTGPFDSDVEAFLWMNQVGMVGLGDLPGGAFESIAHAISIDGSVIVGESHSALGSEAFLWTAGGGMRNLKNVLAGQFAEDLTGWTLLSARDISDDGLTIVGFGRNPSGNVEAWIATVPEPSTFILAVLGLLGLLGIAWRRRARHG